MNRENAYEWTSTTYNKTTIKPTTLVKKYTSEFTNIIKFLNFLPLKSFSKTSALSPNEIKKLEQLSHVSSSTSLKFWSWEKQGLKRIGIFFPLGFFSSSLHCSKNLWPKQRGARLKIDGMCVLDFMTSPS